MTKEELASKRADNTVVRYNTITPLVGEPKQVPVFKSLNELDKTVLSEYKRRAVAAGTRQAFVYTVANQSDEYGFESVEIIGAFQPVSGSDKRVRVLAHWDGSVHVFVLQHRTISSSSPAWQDLVEGYTKAGANGRFRGFQNQKNRRLTEREIDALIAPRVFASR